MKVQVELSGGLDLCFDKQKVFKVDVADKEEIKLKDFILLLKSKYVKDKPDFFTTNDCLRPGILVLINDTDWELEGKDEAIIKNNDSVSFISTLHGG